MHSSIWILRLEMKLFGAHRQSLNIAREHPAVGLSGKR